MAYHLKYKGPAIDERLDLAGTALQEHQDISHLATKEEVAKVSDAKEDVIEDLEEIRSGAKLGATSIQEHQDISHLANQTDVISGLNNKVDKVEGKGLSTEDYTTAEKQKLAALDTTIKQAVDELQVEVAKKQDSIEDLAEIREGASKGATALQEHQDISNLATKEEVSNGLDNKVDKVEGKGLSTEDFTTILKDKLQGLNNYDDTDLSNDIATVERQIASVSANIPTKVSQLTNDSGYLTTHQDISHLATKDELKGKQDNIVDLATIRNGASLGSTALQSVPSEYVTESGLMWTKIEGEAGVRLKGTNGTATGNLAISAGDDKKASDGTQFTSAASGDHAVAFGYGNTCAGRTTLAQGLYNIVNGKDSVAFGQRNLVNGDQAFAAGQQNEVSARIAVAIGYKNKATNTDSIAIGYQNTSSGSASVAMGDTCEASGTSSTAMGYKTKATGAHTSTFGQNTQATNDGEVAMGSYNKSTTSTEASEQTVFSLGIGTSDTNRINAIEIKKNGDVYIGDKILSNFATSQYVDEAITNAIITTLNTEV